MRRFAAVLSLFVFAVSFAVLMMSHTAACPISLPVPVRGLYLKSDVVVVGKIGALKKWKKAPSSEDQNDNYQYFSRTVPIQIEETIKGAPPKDLAVMENQQRWIGKLAYGPQDANQIKLPNQSEAGADFPSSFTENTERRIFFLIRDTDDDYYREAYSSRPFNPEKEALPAYISRLRELRSIYDAPKPAKEMIVEWLVGMAEDPLTRWDGAYELSQALSNLDEKEKAGDPGNEDVSPESGQSPKSLESAENPEKSGDEGKNEETAAAAGTDETANFQRLEIITVLQRPPVVREKIDLREGDGEIARLLTAGQKERLIHVFLNIRFNYREIKEPADDEDSAGEDEEPPETRYEPVLNRADEELMSAVSRLGDRRVIDRLFYELPLTGKYEPAQASEMIDALSEYYDDDKLSSLGEKYSDISWENENDSIGTEETAYDKPATDGEKLSGDKENEEESETAEALKRAQKETYVPGKTYGQRRAELLQQILSRCAEIADKKVSR